MALLSPHYTNIPIKVGKMRRILVSYVYLIFRKTHMQGTSTHVFVVLIVCYVVDDV